MTLEELEELLDSLVECGGEIATCFEWGSSSIKAKAEAIETKEKILSEFAKLQGVKE